MNTRNPSNRKLWCFVIGFLLLVILLPVILAMLPIWDGPPVDDSDMEIVYREIPDEQNAFELFREAEAAMVPRPDLEVWKQWYDDPPAHAEEIRAWVTSNQEAIRLLSEGVALGDYQTPEVKRYTDEVPWITGSLAMGEFLRMAVRMEPDPVKRMDLHLLQLRYAELTYHAGSSLIEALVGIALHSFANYSLFDTLQDIEMDKASLRRLLTALLEIRIDEERMIQALQSEYRALVLFMEEVMRLGGGEYDALGVNFPVSSFLHPFTRPGTWGYQEENTKRLYLECIRPPIAYLRGEMSYELMESSYLKIEELTGPPTPLHPKIYNGIGKLLVNQLSDSGGGLVNKYKETLADLHALRLVTALQLYHREQGHLPDTLQALVPDLLDEVPADPFDGQPFRYLPAEARIYSIGKNREDNGGSIRVITRRRSTPDRNHTEDRVYGVFEEIELEREPGR
ncbi:MAG: hypothetical protein JJU29_22450 [Verrucomicrobia bacterium]|nr:hypothetical protein [Verrucomicrobiota bacterium]MCH8514395.1 type II secretion system protein GspG [Kiritimatiellia bacterium]